MKKKSVKLLVLLLALSMVVTVFVSCDNGGNGSKEETTTKKAVETTTAKEYLDDLPDGLNFENEEITFVSGEPGHNTGTFSARSIGLADYVVGSGNAVDDKVYTRNTIVEERLKVVITPVALTGSVLDNSDVVTDLKSGTSEIDIINGYQYADVTLARDGLIMNTTHLKDYDADYIDYKADYWATSYIDALTYNNQRYWYTGDLGLRYLGGMMAMFVNTELYSDAILGQDDGNGGEYPSIYELVRSGKWTMAELSTMSKMVYQDIGTNPDKVDSGDILGIANRVYEIDAYAISCGVEFSIRDPGGNIFLTLNSENEIAADFVNTAYQLFYKSGNATFTDISTNPTLLFSEENYLFDLNMLSLAETYLTDMASYGIVVAPKLNEEQTSYRTCIWDNCNIFGIYYNASNVPAAAATLEAMAALSLEMVTPEYYDTALKYRYTRDPDSAEMIELLRDTVYVDFVYVWGHAINDVNNFFRTCVSKAYSVSTFKAYESTWEATLDELLLDLDEVEANAYGSK